MILVPAAKIGDYVGRGWWGETTLVEVFLDTAHRQPDAFAVADPPDLERITGESPRRCTWGELAREVGRTAAFLHRCGLRKDDVIVAQLPNGVALHALYLACAALGIVISPVPAQYRAHELAHVVGTTRARVAVTAARIGRDPSAARWLDHVRRFDGLERVAALGAGVPAGAVAMSAGLDAEHPWSAPRLRSHMQAIGLTAHDVVTVCWTSGTEAVPKGVPRNHNEWLIVGRSVIDGGRLQPGAQMLIPFPFVNMAGVSTSLAAWLMVGGGLHHHHPFDVDVFVAQLRAHPVDYTVAAPAVLSMLLEDPRRLEGVDLARLSRIGTGGSPVPESIVDAYGRRHGVEIVNYFGSNEGAALASTPQDIPDRAQRARYFPRIGVPGFEWSASNAKKVRTRLVDLETGRDIVERDRPGELRFQGPTIFSGYYGAPELTARAFDEQGYYRTGDLFEIAGEHGQFYRFVGRHKNIVIRGGVNISAEELEELLLAHPAVREVAIIGDPDPVMGERVCAVVAPREGTAPTLEQLVAYLRDVRGTSATKWPERLVLVEALPRNALGKLVRPVLRERYALRAAGDVPGAPAMRATT